jgi:hypothetical protein
MCLGVAVCAGRAICMRSNPEWAQFARMFEGLCGDEAAMVTHLMTALCYPPRLSDSHKIVNGTSLEDRTPNLAEVGVEGSNPFARSKFSNKLRCV